MILSQKIHEIQFWNRTPLLRYVLKSLPAFCMLNLPSWTLHVWGFLFDCFGVWNHLGRKNTKKQIWAHGIVPSFHGFHCIIAGTMGPQLSSCPENCIFQSLTGLTFVSLQDNYWDGVFQRPLLDQVGNTDFHTEFQGSSIGKWRLFTPSEAWNPLMTRLFWLDGV